MGHARIGHAWMGRARMGKGMGWAMMDKSRKGIGGAGKGQDWTARDRTSQGCHYNSRNNVTSLQMESSTLGHIVLLCDYILLFILCIMALCCAVAVLDSSCNRENLTGHVTVLDKNTWLGQDWGQP